MENSRLWPNDRTLSRVIFLYYDFSFRTIKACRPSYCRPWTYGRFSTVHLARGSISFPKVRMGLTDRLTKEARSWLMSRIKGRDTKPEIVVRSALHRAGFRFRLYHRQLPGKPDIVLAKYKTVVFVHGCFWHGHSCTRGKLPKSNKRFWADKLSSNMARDQKNCRQLKKLGWRVLTIWECKLQNDLQKTLRALFRKDEE